MGSITLVEWAQRLTALAAAAPDDEAPRALAPAFLTWRRGESGEGGLSRAKGGDDALWRALIDESITDGEIDGLIGHGADGPLFPQAQGEAIEVWTERELAGIHALDRLASERNIPAWGARGRRAALWHIEHTQPDNATNRPWALHVFLRLAREANNPDAGLYAETLLHNALVASGRPDPLSAQILADAGEALADTETSGSG